MKVLILGGYGTFGGRLVRLLAGDKRLILVVAGRSQARADAFVRAHAIPGGAALVAACVDRRGGLDEAFARLSPNLVVDASGPFQAYGEGPYRVVEACLQHGVSYVDLADGARFVTGIARFEADARARNLFVISGASTLPALSFAAVRHLARFHGVPIEVRAITAGIAPSPYAGVGLNVVRAIMSYAGKNVTRLRAGREDCGVGLFESKRFTISLPGGVPLAPRRFSLVDVPDLTLARASWPQLQDTWFGAAPVPATLHRTLSLLAGLVHAGRVASLEPLSRLAHWACNTVRWGEARGGMFVRVEGRDGAGATIERSWHLVAEGDDGPFIPSMAAAALIRRCFEGHSPPAGARACTAELELADYEPFFAARSIRHGVREDSASGRPLYARVLGDAWDRLPLPIRRLHGEQGETAFEGVVRVERGRGIGGFAAALAGFPPAAEHLPLRVVFHVHDGRERWERHLGSRRVTSVQWEGRGAREGLLRERMGAIGLAMALVVDRGRLDFVLRGWSLLGIPMPRVLAPRLVSWEEAREGHVRFLVEIGYPVIGMIVRYGGTHTIPAHAPRGARERDQSSVM